MKLIVAVDRHFGIGKEGALLFQIPEDLRFFKETTMGKTLVMGSNTLRSLPGSKALPGREHIVLSSDEEFAPEGVRIVRSVPDLFALLAEEKPAQKTATGGKTEQAPADDTVFVVGGASVYAQLLPYCDTAYVTKVDTVDPEADCFFPDIDAASGWLLTEVSAPRSHEGLKYCFCVYKNDALLAPPLPPKTTEDAEDTTH